MKKIAICLLTACLSLTLLPTQAIAEKPADTKTVTTTYSADAERVKALELRLNEIKAMDKSKMKASEKKKLRKEVKSINRDIHDIGGGVYISAGAIIVVLILLLVLL
jgi:hypothetical protein